MTDIKVDDISGGNLGKTKRMVLTGVFFGVAIILSIVESMIPPIPLPIPGVKFGLSNIAVMYVLFFLSKSQAFTIAILKSLFVLTTRGLIAGILSFTGGILSLSCILLILLIFGQDISYLVISIVGAVSHNIGQFIAITIIYKGLYLFAYIPVLLVSGVAAGIVTATLLRFIIPAFKRLI